MLLFGLTGGVGMGKSAAGQLLADAGILVIDTDQLARDLVVPGEPALEEIVAEFGSQLLDEAGGLRRKELARIVFADRKKRARLETILHPRIRAAWRRHAEKERASARDCAVVMIPLLFETGADAELDKTICVSCRESTQIKRLRARGWEDGEIKERIAAQMSAQEKMDRANYVVWNEFSFATCGEQLQRIPGLGSAMALGRKIREKTSEIIKK